MKAGGLLPRRQEMEICFITCTGAGDMKISKKTPSQAEPSRLAAPFCPACLGRNKWAAWMRYMARQIKIPKGICPWLNERLHGTSR